MYLDEYEMDESKRCQEPLQGIVYATGKRPNDQIVIYLNDQTEDTVIKIGSELPLN